MFPITRMRRKRQSAAFRDLVRETSLNLQQIIYPIFVEEEIEEEVPIQSLPDISRIPEKKLNAHVKELYAEGIRAILLFGISKHKDEIGSDSLHENGLLARMIKIAKNAEPEMLVISDNCFCEYTTHGHCGVLGHRNKYNDGDLGHRNKYNDGDLGHRNKYNDGDLGHRNKYNDGDLGHRNKYNDGDLGHHTSHNNDSAAHHHLDNDATLKNLALQAVVSAKAGADIIAPSSMMDGQIAAIRAALDEAGFENTPIMAYSTKFASCFYGPFREAAGSTFKGDRRTYQMDIANRREALQESLLDEQEGADFLMVKPAMTSLDIISDIYNHSSLPIAAYQVSGEYAAIKFAAKAGALDEESAMLESLTVIKRAGASIIISYFARNFAKLLKTK